MLAGRPRLIWDAVRIELGQLLRNGWYWAWAVVIPIVAAFIASAVISALDDEPDATVLVVDEDQSEPTAAIVAGLIEVDAELSGITLEVADDLDGARSQMAAGDADAAILFVDGFGDVLRAEEPPPVVVVVDDVDSYAGSAAHAVAADLATRFDVGRVAVAGLLSRGETDPALLPQVGAAGLAEPRSAEHIVDDWPLLGHFAIGWGLVGLFVALGLVWRRPLAAKGRVGLIGRLVACAVTAELAFAIVAVAARIAGAGFGPPRYVVPVLSAGALAALGLSLLASALPKRAWVAPFLSAAVGLVLGVWAGVFLTPQNTADGWWSVAALSPIGRVVRTLTDLATQGTGGRGAAKAGGALILVGAGSLAVGAKLLLSRARQDRTADAPTKPPLRVAAPWALGAIALLLWVTSFALPATDSRLYLGVVDLNNPPTMIENTAVGVTRLPREESVRRVVRLRRVDAALTITKRPGESRLIVNADNGRADLARLAARQILRGRQIVALATAALADAADIEPDEAREIIREVEPDVVRIPVRTEFLDR